MHYSKRNCDFGIGFYVTSRLNQAIKWAKRKTKDEIAFNPNVKPVVLSYKFPHPQNITPKIFEITNLYFEFVYKNRLQLNAKSGKNIHNFPMVFGPVLDGQIIHLQKVIENLFAEKYSLTDTANILLGNHQDDDQLCICNQNIANSLILIKEEEYDFKTTKTRTQNTSRTISNR